MLFLFRCFIFIFIFNAEVHGQVFVNRASIEISGEQMGVNDLPYYYEGMRTSLQTVSSKYILPTPINKNERFYGILIPYPIQGGGIYLNGVLIYKLEESSNDHWFNWYRPVLINVSTKDFNPKSENLLEFRQVGHLRGWAILPVVWGAISELRPIYEILFYLSQTLVETINFLCGFVGVFFILIGVLARQKKYLYPGAAAVIWVFLFKLALLPDFSSSNWFAWRLVLYFLTGNLILFSTLFLINFFSIKLKYLYVASFAFFCQLGWLTFFSVGPASEYFLDIYWTGGAVGAYVGYVAYTFFARTNVNIFFAVLFALYLVLSGVFALHDFAIQAGFMFKFNDPIINLIGNAIYLSHFSLPAFLLTASVLLSIDYLGSKNDLVKVLKENTKIRDEILSDIHDGVGARLNVLLLGLELKTLDFDMIKEDVHRCIDELRFVLVSENEKTPFLIKLIADFCENFSYKISKKNINFNYLIHSDELAVLSPKLALILYFSTLECLNNIIKHASASSTYINYSLNVLPGSASFFIEDNGPGIQGWSNSNQRFISDNYKVGLGLKSMIARVKANGGEISIMTKLGESTVISILFEI